MQHLMVLTLVQLEYIVAVDQYRNFSNAAEACHVTQPTLSMQLKKLEEQLGVILFDRSKHPVVPTEVGREVVDQARKVLREAKQIEEIIRVHQGKISGTLKIGMIPTLTPYLLPRFVGRMAREFPDVQLQIKELQTEQIVEALNTDALDAGILVTPLHESDIVEKPLFYEEIVVYTNPNHKFESQLEVEKKDLASPDLWLMSEGHCFRDQVLNLCSYDQARGKTLPIRYESGSLETLKKLVDREGGFTLLPELAYDELDEDSKDRIRTFSDERPMREVSLVFARSFAKASLVEALENVIKASIPPEMLTPKRGSVVEWK